MYAEAMGVSPDLEAIAQWVQWADTANTNRDTDNASYNCQQFWTAKAALASDFVTAHMRDLVYLDGLAHSIMGYTYMRKTATAGPKDIPGLSAKQQIEFTQAQTDFLDIGETDRANDAGLRAGQAQNDADQDAENYVDDSYLTAFRDQTNKVLDAAGSVINAAGAGFAFLKNPVVLVGVAALVGYLLLKGRR